MQVHNVSSTPRYLAYAGATIKPGCASKVLPLQTIFSNILWTDVKSGGVQFKLSDDDRATLAKVLEQDARPLKEVQVAKPVPPEEKVKAKAAANKAALEAEAARRAKRAVKLSTAETPDDSGLPDAMDAISSVALPGADLPMDPDAPMSLAEIKKHNAGVAQAARASKPKPKVAPPEGVPINKTPGGTPDFGDAFVGTSKEQKADALADANTLLSGLV